MTIEHHQTTPADISQRIANALTQEGAVSPPIKPNQPFDPDKDTILGTLPPHLQHLYKLQEETLSQARAIQSMLEMKVKELEAVTHTLHTSIYSLFPGHEDYSVVRLGENWQIVASGRRSGDHEPPKSFGEFLLHLFKSH